MVFNDLMKGGQWIIQGNTTHCSNALSNPGAFHCITNFSSLKLQQWLNAVQNSRRRAPLKCTPNMPYRDSKSGLNRSCTEALQIVYVHDSPSAWMIKLLPRISLTRDNNNNNGTPSMMSCVSIYKLKWPIPRWNYLQYVKCTYSVLNMISHSKIQI